MTTEEALAWADKWNQTVVPRQFRTIHALRVLAVEVRRLLPLETKAPTPDQQDAQDETDAYRARGGRAR